MGSWVSLPLHPKGRHWGFHTMTSHPQELDHPYAQAYLNHFQVRHMEQARIQISIPESRMAGYGRWMGAQAASWRSGAREGCPGLPLTSFSPPPACPPQRGFYRCLLKGLSKVMFSSTVAFSSHGF